MTMDLEKNMEKIKEAFSGKSAWAYAEQHDSVKIGKWDGTGLVFYEPIKQEYLLLLRVFDKERELKFTGDKFRDTEIYKNEDFIQELADAKYYMYGEQEKVCGDYTMLSESRGGMLYFPALLNFPEEHPKGLMLGIRRYVRYNPIPVLPISKGNENLYELNKLKNPSGAGALEVVDYAFTGFYYTDGNEV